MSLQDEQAAHAAEALSRYKDRPWDYLESEGTEESESDHEHILLMLPLNPFPFAEYIERYGTNPVWEGYRRNHKGGIPPQKTRKTCIVCVRHYTSSMNTVVINKISTLILFL